MTSDRPYRRARPAPQAAEEVDRCSGTQFDPEIAIAFLAAWESGAFVAAPDVRGSGPGAVSRGCERSKRAKEGARGGTTGSSAL